MAIRIGSASAPSMQECNNPAINMKNRIAIDTTRLANFNTSSDAEWLLRLLIRPAVLGRNARALGQP